jgi:hypothetical protein
LSHFLFLSLSPTYVVFVALSTLGVFVLGGVAFEIGSMAEN